MYEGPATIDAVLRHRVERAPDAPLVRLPDRTVTYGALDRSSATVAAALRDGLGIGLGDRVGVMLPNGEEFLATWFALARLGVLEVPLHTAYRGRILTYVLAQARIRTVIVAAEHEATVREAAREVATLEHIVVVGGDPGGDGGPAGHSYEELYAAYEPATLARHLDPFAPSAVLYTSGTTGPSKGVVLTHNANFRLARTMSEAAGFRAGEILFTAFPLFHVAARYVSVLAAMLIDGRVVLHDRFSASTFWRTCADEEVTAVNYLGSLLPILLEQPPTEGGDRAHAVRLGYGSGAPLPVLDAFEERFGVRLYELYGMTETGAVTMNRDDAYRRGSCGRPMPDCEVEIHDERDRALPPGVEGEIVVRPSQPHIMMEEYLAMPEATVRAFRNLWLHTGDRGRFDEDGFLHFAGRQKDAIRRRGENVSAYEVELVLAEHPEVAECAVIGVDDPISGEEVMAVVVARAGASRDPASLVDHAIEHLPRFAVPRYVRHVDELPKNTSQRVEKYRLREEGVTADTWDRERDGAASTVRSARAGVPEDREHHTPQTMGER